MSTEANPPPRKLKPYQLDYLSLSLAASILRFDGPFTLKSGRQSPYFFNAGLFNDGEKLARLADCYAQMIVDSGVEFDVLFGPAYKGIPLAATVAQSLYVRHGRSVGFAYNRKEAKSHGEGGVLVGADLAGKRVVILDDVMTAGTAIREAVQLIGAAGVDGGAATPDTRVAGVCIALDRQERTGGGATTTTTGGSGAHDDGDGEATTTRVSRELGGVPVMSVVTLDDIITYLGQVGGFEAQLKAMGEYRAKYGVVATTGANKAAAP